MNALTKRCYPVSSGLVRAVIVMCLGNLLFGIVGLLLGWMI